VTLPIFVKSINLICIHYYSTQREPLRDEVLELIEDEKLSLLKRKKLGDRILKRIVDFVETFINGMNLN